MKNNTARARQNRSAVNPAPQAQTNSSEKLTPEMFSKRLTRLGESNLEWFAQHLEEQALVVRKVLWQNQQRKHQGN